MSIKNTDYSLNQLHQIFSNAEKIFFIGIGGISMSAAAEFCATLGKEIYGYDKCRSPQSARLEKMAKIKYSSTPDNVKGMDIVVYTNAIDSQNLEYKQAKRLKIPLVSRGNFLGYLISLHKRSVGVCGAHGKSTVTAMLAHIFHQAEENPTVFCGAEMMNFGSNFKFGGRGCCIFEACEYQNSFLSLPTTDAVVLNIDYDHPDFFKSLEDVKSSFQKYVSGAKRVFLNCDDSKARELCHKNTVTFGFDKLATFRAVLTEQEESTKKLGPLQTTFKVFRQGELLCTCKIPFCGKHMVYNALCAVAVAHSNGLPVSRICNAVFTFSGTKRRMEFLRKNDTGTDIFEDYAHHPTEIQATLSALSDMGYKRILCVFQAHTFSRTHFLYDRFKECFQGASHLIIAPTFSAREENIFELSEERFALDCGGEFISDPKIINKKIRETDCDCAVIMGAGDIAAILASE